MDYKKQTDTKDRISITKRAGLDTLSDPSHSVSQAKIKFNSLCDLVNATKNPLTSRKNIANRSALNESNAATRKTHLHDIAFSSINSNLIESSRLQQTSKILKRKSSTKPLHQGTGRASIKCSMLKHANKYRARALRYAMPKRNGAVL